MWCASNWYQITEVSVWLLVHVHHIHNITLPRHCESKARRVWLCSIGNEWFFCKLKQIFSERSLYQTRRSIGAQQTDEHENIYTTLWCVEAARVHETTHCACFSVFWESHSEIRPRAVANWRRPAEFAFERVHLMRRKCLVLNLEWGLSELGATKKLTRLNLLMLESVVISY